MWLELDTPSTGTGAGANADARDVEDDEETDAAVLVKVIGIREMSRPRYVVIVPCPHLCLACHRTDCLHILSSSYPSPPLMNAHTKKN